MIAGKLEITIKSINELPQPKIVENPWQEFDPDCDRRRITTIIVKPKIYKKLTDVTSNYPQWVVGSSDV